MLKRLISKLKGLFACPVRISPEEMQAKRREYDRLAKEEMNK